MKLNLEYQGYENMIVCPPISTSAKNAVCLSGNIQSQMGSKLCSVISRRPASSCFFCSNPGNSKTKYTRLSVSENYPSNVSQTTHRSFVSSCFSKERGKLWSLTVKDLVNAGGPQRRHLKISLANHALSLVVPKQRMLPKISCNGGPSWRPGCASAGLICGLLVCYSSSGPVHVHAEAAQGGDDEEDDCDSSHMKLSRGRNIYTDYSVIGIPGDGRCMFRSVAHGACLRSGKPAPSESLQRELADDLRARVADEFIKRREETEWFVEGDFDTYVSEIRKPHVWGGEPELFMASHVLQMPITVYMHDRDAGGLISIAEYGQEYGKENPIRVLYHGFGHYDALQIPRKKGNKSRL
ncbi:OTU domain containing protein [Trema orientale]|uniref:Ubiquitin thioesterase OTU n=1 Tax=Trema orientale TaxID=63057 RepID=A0A2P5F1I8_TREOI|nr:OTU domain containing protein [Trema orientale]